jgi:hypothetical protein
MCNDGVRRTWTCGAQPAYTPLKPSRDARNASRGVQLAYAYLKGGPMSDAAPTQRPLDLTIIREQFPILSHEWNVSTRNVALQSCDQAEVVRRSFSINMFYGDSKSGLFIDSTDVLEQEIRYPA